MPVLRAASRAPAIVAIAAFALLVTSMLVAVGQPVFTDDAWLHLALGERYQQTGPWLDSDPLLAEPLGPPTPSAWLFDVLLASVHDVAGFAGLRVLHVALVAAIVLLGWSILRRSSGSTPLACAAGAAFVCLSAYRLVQLRPGLLTMLATLLLFRLLFASGAVPSRIRVILSVALLGIWANCHAGFLLGPVLIAAGLAGVVVHDGIGGAGWLPGVRARMLLAALILGLLATIVNPGLLDPHLAYFVAGSDTPALASVTDEWGRLDLLDLPPVGLPPSWLSWGLLWVLFAITLGAALVLVRRKLMGRVAWRGGRVDAGLAAIALVSLVFCLVAVRFLWLGFFPVLVLVRIVGASAMDGRRDWHRDALAATCAWILIPAFFAVGAWPMIAGSIPRTVAAYAEPYRAGKYHADAIWLLADADVHGDAYAEYYMSGFAGYWLAPRIRTLVNGTLNVAPAILNAVPFIQHRVAERPDETYTAMLDRLGIDVFVGIRLPRATDTERPWTYTTTHLEGEPGWIALFRNMTTAVYLRDSARNADNLARVAHYYESVRVPFDPHEGFDPELVVRSNRSWAIDHGMLPVLFDSIASAAYGVDPDRKRNARDHLASIYATLGLYELAVELDRHALSERPDDGAVRRRLVWCLLRLRRASEAVELAEPLGLEAPEGSLAHDVALSAGAALDAKSDDELAALLAATPLFTRAEAARLAVGVRVPVARTSRR